MKLVINYDVLEQISNEKDNYNTFKILRNNKSDLAFYTSFNYLMNCTSVDPFVNTVASCSGAIISVIIIDRLLKPLRYGKKDIYRDKAIKNLKKLTQELNDLNIKTDYDLLLQSELYYKKSKIEINEKKIPQLMQEKYILVPTYDYNGYIKETSILQEHIVGSKEYVLSLGSPKREFKLAYSMN